MPRRGGKNFLTVTALPHIEVGRSTPDVRLSYLREGREAAFEGHAQTLMHTFAGVLGSTATAGTTSGRTMRFTMTRLNLALRGFGGDRLHSLVLAESDTSWTTNDSSFWSKVENSNEMPIILACGVEEYTLAKRKTAGRLALILSPDDLSQILTASRPLDQLKLIVRREFTPGQIHPFDHQHPAVDASFRGRHAFLQTFRDNPNTNFALVGPSKMGKTSLVRRHIHSVTAGGRGGRQVYVDLLDRPVNDLAFTRAIRMALDPSLSAYYDPAETISDFLCKLKSRLGGPIEITIDECDRHLELQSMRVLIHLAVRGVCRLILIGRWQLMRHAVHTQDDNFNRLEPAVMPPLSMDEAMDLIESPLHDMGFDLTSLRHELRNAVNRLGRVPGLIQELGAFFVEESERVPVTDALRRALNRIISTSRLIGLLNDLSSAKSRAGALMLALQAEKGGVAEPLWLRDRFKEQGVAVGIAECMEICDELVIHHLLGYDNGIYRMARWDIVAESRQQRLRFEAMLEEMLDASKLTSPIQ